MRVCSFFFLLSCAAASDDCFLPIHSAAQAGDATELATLLAEDKFQADAEDKCETGIRPLLLAANSGSLGAVKQLLDAGASTNVAHSGNGLTPLIAATMANSTIPAKHAAPNVKRRRAARTPTADTS